MSKARSTGNIGNIIKTSTTCVTVTDGTTDLLIMSGSGRVTIPGDLVVLGGIAGSSAESASYSLSSSFATNANLLDGIDGASFLQTGSFNTFSSSIDTTIKNKLNGDGVISGSVQVDITSTTGYSTFSSSLSSSIGSLSGSVATTTSGLASRIGGVETKTGSYATTGSNVFVGSQVITGSLYITTDLIVQGSSSLQNITASAVSIGTNTVILNTDTPAVRFAGISVQDSGSNAGVTGSIFWDGLCNRWIYSNPSDIGYSGGMLLSGPRTATLGSESPLTCNYIAKSGGGDHLYDSCIIDDGTTICVKGNLIGTGTACFGSAITVPSVSLGAGGSVDNLSNINYGGYTWGSYNTSNGTITFSNVTGCGIKFATGEACFASAINSPGGTISQDLRIYRSGGTTTGYINFGSTGTNYFGFDGTKYVANGVLSSTNGLFSGCVGIGATTVGAQLHIEKDGADVDIKFTDVGVGSFMMGLRDGCARFEIASGNCLGTNTALSIDTSGRVGISTNPATYSLSVGGRGYFFATNQDSGWGQLTLDYGNGNNSNIQAIQMKEGGAINSSIGYGSYGSSSCGDIVMWANDGGSLVERMRIFASGHSRFYVNESSSSTNGFAAVGIACSKAVYLGANCTYVYVQSHGSVPLYINELGNNVILNLNGGNVGIGTTNFEGSKLLVDGNIGFAGDTTKYLYMPNVNQGTGSIYMQAGFGSSQAGGAVRLHGHNATSYVGGDVEVGLSGKGSFLVNSTIGGTRFLTLNIAGNLGLGVISPLTRLDARSNASYTSAITQPAFFGSNDVTGPLGIVIQTICASGNAIRTEITSTRYGVSGNDLTLNRDSGAGAGGLTVKYQGNVGVNDSNPTHNLDVNGTTRIQDTTMLGSNVGLLQFAMDGARWNSYPYSVLHIKTSILKGSDTMIAFNIRGYMYSPNTVDTDVAFYNYNPSSSPYGVTIHHKAYSGWSIGLYYSSDNYVTIYVDGMSTYGGFALNWINTSLIQWGGRVFALASTKVNTTAAQY
jgi:hypothetical protein